MEHQSKQQDGFFGGPPKTMFVFGVVSGIALTAIVAMLALNMNGVSLASNNGAEAENTGAGTVPTPTAVAPTPVAPTAPTPNGTLPTVTEDDWIRGNLDTAKVVLVEYSDFECPFCANHHPTMSQLRTEFGDDVAWVYRHFPLSFHPQATPSALASECVGEQAGDEGFWEFADAMFENQGRLGPAFYEETAQAIGVNMDQYRECYDSNKYVAKIQDQQATGAAAGVTGTPGTFVNGQVVSGAVPYSTFKTAVEAAL